MAGERRRRHWLSVAVCRFCPCVAGGPAAFEPMTPDDTIAPRSAELLDAVVAAKEGGTRRPGQDQMAAAVAGSLASGRHLLVEAPTGTGKSLAYIVPAVAYLKSSVGEPAVPGTEPDSESPVRIVISTATKALQEQLVEVDLPFVQSVLAEDQPFTFAMLKGRSNYVCRARLAPYNGDEGHVFAPPSEEVATVVEWATETTQGDRSEVGEISDEAWSHVSVGSEECPGVAACEFGSTCFAEAAKGRARAADVVVVNTHLYAADLVSGGNVLPPHAAVIFDEAHEVEDILVSSFSVSLSAARLRSVAALARSGGASAKVLERLRLLVPSFEDSVQGSVGETIQMDTADSLTEVLKSVGGVCASAVTSLSTAEVAGQQAKAANLQATAALRSLAADVETALGRVGDSGTATWVDGTEERPRFCAANIDIAPVLAAGLYPNVTVIGTSATLAVGGTFASLARRLGLTLDVGEGLAAYDTLRVDTPFDYSKQGILYVASHLPDPTKQRSEFEVAAREEVAKLAVAAGGRTLALFTSWAAARAAAEHLRDVTDLNVLCQGESSRGDLIDEFSETPRSVLVATSSFWTGLDLHGDKCTLVVIDRIPFGRPNDPVVVARERIASERGGNGFRDVSLPAAAVSLAQGVGRLIRSDSDRGVVAVLDRRLVAAPYGKLLLDTLPPLWRTNDLSRVTAALGRLDAAAIAAAAP